MNEHFASVVNAYTAIVIVSPMGHGEDKKDQDRARFFGPGQSACLCDGVTSSHNSARAAEMATSFAPALFQGSAKRRLGVLCDLLMAHRQECMASSDTSMPKGLPEGMQQMLQKAVRDKKAESFQTTMIAAQFTATDRVVSVRVVRCGDSALFAFSPEGELFTSTLARGSPQGARDGCELSHRRSENSTVMSFGPGDDILVRIDGPLSQYESLAQAAGIHSEHIRNWIACTPVESCRCEQTKPQAPAQTPDRTLLKSDRLVVPRYLYGQLLTSEECQYLVVRYSSSIRIVSSSRPAVAPEKFETGGSSTFVLPDHFYTEAYECFADTFPRQTQFLLCSDGFYGAFPSWPDMYQWLRDNASLLRQEDLRVGLLEKLHAQLHSRKGDDDISLIWVQPRDLAATVGGPKHVR